MLENIERPVNFTYPEEESMWHADNPDPDQRKMNPYQKDLFLMIQKQFNDEFAEFKNFLDRKLTDKDGETIPGETYFLMFGRKLYYIEFPEIFQKDIEGLGASYWDNLDWVDRAWIQNTRDLVREYHKICVAEKMKIWPEMAKGEK